MDQRDTYAFCDHLVLDKLETTLKNGNQLPQMPFMKLPSIGTQGHKVSVVLTSKELLKKRLAKSELTLGEITPMTHDLSGLTFPSARITDDLGDELLIIPQEIETDLLTPNFTGRLVQAEPYNGGNIASRFIHAYESHNNSSIPILYATPENTDQLKLRN